MKKDNNQDNQYSSLENKFNIFSDEFRGFLQDYKRKSRRLDKIIKLSDKQQFEMMKLNEQLDEYKNHLEQKVNEKTKELQELNKNLEQRVQEEVEANRKKDKHLHDQAKFAQLGELRKYSTPMETTFKCDKYYSKWYANYEGNWYYR
jgi:methyl-accepting chemotaxis protein